jgi:acyl-CoA reductase-like NAD-dependent aldehyde dehydrogenase
MTTSTLATLTIGVGQSGLGRELGAEGIRAFTQLRGYVRQPAPR